MADNLEKLILAEGPDTIAAFIAEQTDDRVLLENVDRLFTGLRRILIRHNGVLSNYVGDAFFATWESAAMVTTAMDIKEMTAAAREAIEKAAMADAAEAAVAFAVEAAEAVPAIAAGLTVRDPDGGQSGEADPGGRPGYHRRLHRRADRRPSAAGER